MSISYSAGASSWQGSASVSRRSRNDAVGKGVAVVLGSGACVLLALVLFTFSDQYRHWFMIPVTICGMFVTSDVLSLLKAKRKIYDPAVLVSAYGIHFFFVAPLLHVYYDYWLIYAPDSPGDWRPWLGGMACFNFIGLVIYKSVRNRFMNRSDSAHSGRIWVPRRDILAGVFLAALPAVAAFQWWAYSQFGGISGFINTFEGNNRENFSGFGLVFSVGESFPILAFIALCIFVLSKRRRVDIGTITIALGMVLVLSVFFGGLRGSRTLIVGNVLWAAGIVHFTLRPLSKRVMLVGVCAIVAFMYAFGFYKHYGRGGMDYLLSDGPDSARAEYAPTIVDILLGDLGRTGIQAYALYRLWKPGSDYQYTWGSTYLGAAGLLIPKQFRPQRLVGVTKAGTEMVFGQGAYVEGTSGATYVYGLAGEAMLNFTPWAIPLSFAALGLVVGYVHWWFRQLPRGDLRWYIAPPIALLTISTLTGTSDNLIYSICTTLVIPSSVLLFGAKRVFHQVRPRLARIHHVAPAMPHPAHVRIADGD